MADEEQEQAGGGASGGSVLKKYGPLAAIVLLAQVVLAWVVIQMTMKDKVSSQEPEEELLAKAVQPQAEGGSAVEAKELPFYLVREDLQRITANPAGTNAQRFVVVGVQLGLSGQNADGDPLKPDEIGADIEALAKVDANLGKIKSVLVMILGKKYVDQFENEMPDLAEEIKRELNRLVFSKVAWDEKGKKRIEVSEVIFTDKIIQ